MTNLTPKAALDAYRDTTLNTPSEIHEQAKLFDRMPIKDRLSLMTGWLSRVATKRDVPIISFFAFEAGLMLAFALVLIFAKAPDATPTHYYSVTCGGETYRADTVDMTLAGTFLNRRDANGKEQIIAAFNRTVPCSVIRVEMEGVK